MFNLLLRICVVVAFTVVVLGAYVRLSDAGLSCPDWPVCYGQITWPTAAEEIDTANQAFPERPVETDKAWKEQVHRFLAAFLGSMILVLALQSSWKRPWRRTMIILAAIAAIAGTVLYVRGHTDISVVLSWFAIGLPAIGLIFWGDDGRARFTAGLLGLVILQAMLGMWTVTLLLKPVIVMAHLLGGLTILLLLWILVLGSTDTETSGSRKPYLFPLALVALVIVYIQISLGGWTSANYAALVCPDFPTCRGLWFPPMDFKEGFTLWRGLGLDYEGGILGSEARTAIQVTHRLGAVVTLLALITASVVAWSSGQRRMKVTALFVMLLVFIQFSLGVANIELVLPLPVAAAHNAVAALLLLSVGTLLYYSAPGTFKGRKHFDS